MPRRAKPRASEQVVFEWLGRVEAEYRSAAITQETVLWLIQMGASPDLIRAGLRIVDDELVHAEMSRKVWAAAGGEGVPRLDRQSLGLGRAHADLERDVVDAIVKIFCLNETVAVPLFSNLRRFATVPVARRALDRILKDEVRHRDFGWTALAWLLERPDAEAIRGRIRAGLPGWLADLERCYGDDLVGGTKSVTDDERAWGLAPAHEFAAILHRTVDRDYRRRFARLGIALEPTVARTVIATRRAEARRDRVRDHLCLGNTADPRRVPSMMRLSRSRRARTLAAPIVVTAVLAPACSGRTHTNPREPEERPQPEPTETAVPTAQPEPTATAAASGSATAIDLAKLPVVPKDANGRFERNDDGSCTFYPRDDCPPGATCNPGPPRQVRCHDGVPDKPSK